MKNPTSRRGSALLIVLGMLAFMIVSAVAFSAYMRSARLPSSYLRRTSASRQLVKAALARAIDEIDRAVCNNPHPGVGTESVSGRRRNYWKRRVYLGTNAFASVESTVPVLTLEGLAYVPPPLVNAARYYSRRSPAAEWKPFGFDAGRYAFCAIDVSDYFDVNRLSADLPRASADNQRISLAYLFENYDHKSPPGADAEKWDAWMQEFRTEEEVGFSYASQVPLVSLADFNLALGEETIGGFGSPFCRYVNHSDGKGFGYYDSDAQNDLVGRMTFVTDSWFPASKLLEAEENGAGGNGGAAQGKEILDLANDGQPFDPQFLSGGGGGPKGGNSTTIDAIFNYQGSKGMIRMQDSLPVLSMVSLFDYLDCNRVPVTLAAPTFERTPMICGLRPNFDSAKVKVQEPVGKDKLYKELDCQTLVGTENEGATRTVYQRVVYRLDASELVNGLMNGATALVVHPFARANGTSAETFGVDGRVLLFFTVEGAEMKLRTKTMSRNSANDTSEVLHLRKKNFTDEDEPGLNASTGLMMFRHKISPRQFGKDVVSSEEETLEELPLDVKGDVMAGAKTIGEASLVELTYQWEQTWTESAGTYTPTERPANAVLVKAHCGIPPLTAAGETDSNYANDEKFLALVKSGAKPKFKMNVALQTRIFDSNGKTVDLVPACLADDKVFNDTDNGGMDPKIGTLLGANYPVMRFDTSAVVELSEEGLAAANATPAPLALSQAVMVADPRFNHAPESWYKADDLSKARWLETNLSAGRSGDIFMETSDQGYLQSIYELAFLPRFCALQSHDATYGDTILGAYYKNPETVRTDFAASAGAAANSGMMWRTYDLFGSERCDFEGMGFVSGGRGYKINPYTDSTNVMMAAFANTPVNWSLASTNDQAAGCGLGVSLTAADFNKKYAWNEYCQNSRFKWEDLQGVAGSLMSRIRGVQPVADYDTPPPEPTTATNWEDAWDDLWASDTEETLAGHVLSTETRDALWSVDRKFLYGYWSDCFAVRQQLFLLFVRAEPLMMGGGDMGRIPPQLGARAVALVWRDPTETPESASGGQRGYPHRTRVLFYKQLD